MAQVAAGHRPARSVRRAKSGGPTAFGLVRFAVVCQALWAYGPGFGSAGQGRLCYA